MELRKANLELERLAHRDALTGLANRRAANERLNQEYERLKRNHVEYAVLLIDIDFFKRINDTFGHPMGDEALRHLTSILESNLREMDFVARFGGEEFIVLLPETTLAQAIIVAEKLRLACANTPLNERVSFTISIGVAIASTAHNDEYEALNLADAELYKAKNLGRNCVVACSPALVSSFDT
jgi:diguanylate cyclase